ncbi:MAG: GNAT family N-acetyltransferase [Mesorhizobium sp.]|nr:MAG: GNAT family N-acetyltransferase [Mesorhizobium sp.]
MTVQLVVNPANAFPQEDRSAFVALVKKDPQVNKETLPGFVDGAHFLAFLRLDGALSGTCAIKNNRQYQRRLEGNDKAAVSLPDADFFAEIGYLHVDKKQRGARLGDFLILGALATVRGKGLFATIQSKNIPSRRLFERYGFTQVGKPWASEQKDDQVHLYVRPGR